jgi:hypothetical protein
MPQSFCWNCGASSITLTPLTDPPPGISSLDLTHLLTSNDVPLDPEISVIQDIISDGQERVDTLDAQIHILQATLARLIPRRDDAAEQVRQHRAILSPIRRVPPELICHIFSLTLSSSDMDGMNQPPWYLGLICRSWRHSSLAYPSLWSLITVPSSLSSEDGHLLSKIEAQLLRTANAPVDIYWREVQSDVDSRLLDLVLPHCSRWRSLCFNVDPPYDHCVLDWLHPINGHLHQLEKLEVNNAYNTMLPDVFSTAPNLRQVNLTDEDFADSSIPISLAIPWGQITHYRGTYTVERQLNILKDAVNLTECTIGFRNIHRLHPSTSPTVLLLPHLRRLCIEDDSFLVHLRAPVLEDLVSVSFLSTTLIPFVDRSSCTLKKLVLMGCTISPELITVLRSLPRLTYLLLANQDDETTNTDSHTLFSAMFISGAPSDICPNLTSFLFGYTGAFPWNICCAMAYSRFRARPSRLAYLRIFNAERLDTAPPQAMVAQIEMLRGEGLDAAVLDREETLGLKRLFCTDRIFPFSST